MERLRGAGCTVGEYVGDGQGESASVGSEGGTLDAGPEVERQELEEDADDDDENETGSEDHPLLILYDCEATGFSVYSDHITDIGAKVIAAPTPLLHCTFSSLVRTPRTIPAAGKKKKKKNNNNNIQLFQYHCCDIFSDQAYRHITSYAEN